VRVVLTGVTGYLGSHLALSLLANGCEVIGLKRKLSSLCRIKNILDKLILHDIDDINFYELLNQHGKVDAIIHTATCYGRGGESAIEIVSSNIVFPLGLLEAAASSRCLFVNTDTVLGGDLNKYTLSKAQFLEWGRYFSKRQKIHFLNLKLEHFYGPGDNTSKFTTYVINSCLSNVSELKLTNGEQHRDFIYIDDVVDAYLLLLNKQELFNNNFTEFEIGSGNAITIKQFAETVHCLTSSKTFLNFGAIPYRAGEVMFTQANTRAIQSLGWECKVDIETGIRLIISQEKNILSI